MMRVIVLLLACLGLRAEPATYTSDGRLVLPGNYREWIYLSSGLGMTYGIGGKAVHGVRNPRFDNVFVTPEAYASYVATGTWPDKTVFVMEVRSSSAKGSINRGGRFQEELVTVEAHVKDKARFANGWEFFVFGKGQTARPLGAGSSCQICHEKHGAVDTTFVQFYPTLRRSAAR